jgi:uncharacterized protein YbcI
MARDATEESSVGPPADADQLPLLAAVSKTMVRIYKEQFGRGPTKTRTYWAGPDVLVCVLENTFTPAEKRLAEMQEFSRLRETRTFFQYASEKDFVEPIEQMVGRRVHAFVSGIDAQRDVAIELWTFHPSDGDGRHAGSRESDGDGRRAGSR